MADEIKVIKDGKEYRTIVTRRGQEKIAQAALEGRKVNIVEMVLGDGGGAPCQPSEEKTSLVNEVWRGGITYKKVMPTSPNVIEVRTEVDSTVGGFTVREAALVDDEGEHIVTCNLPDIAKVGMLDGVSTDLTVVMLVAFVSAEAVEIVISNRFDAVTAEEMQDAIAAHNADPNAHGGIAGGGGEEQVPLTIPATGWTENTDSEEELGLLHVDVEIEEARDSHIPWLSINPRDRETAKRCGMTNQPRSLDGIVRVYAVKEPEQSMDAYVVLRGAGGGGTAGAYTLPMATSTRLGGVKIGPGLKIGQDGTTSVDWSEMDEEAVAAVAEKVTPSEEAVESMLDEIFQPWQPDETPAT